MAVYLWVYDGLNGWAKKKELEVDDESRGRDEETKASASM